MNETSDNIMNAGSAFMDSAMKIGAEAMKTQSQMFAQQIKLVEKWVEAGNKHMELARDIRDPADYFAKASAITSEFGQEVATIVREVMELQMEVGGSMVNTIRDEMTKGIAT